MTSTRDTILSHRTTLGWTNYRLAKESGVPESTVRRYLAGKIDTTTEKADRMMGAMATQQLPDAPPIAYNTHTQRKDDYG